MAVYFVGPGGNNSNNGLTWQTRKLTLNGAEDIPLVAGDKVYVGAGTYRELLTVDVSGGNVYTSGTVSVVQGSPTVDGVGTSWLSNVGPDYIFQSTVLASGNDGVTTLLTGTSHVFTSAAGNFQQGHIGLTIRINTIGAFFIRSVSSPTSITFSRPDSSSFVVTGTTGLTYNVGPESPYDILRVDSDTQLTLTKPWSGPTLSNIAYTTFNPIRFIGDYTGQVTDGVGGMVRITGSDNDQSTTRAQCINASAARNYRVWQGFSFDMAVTNLVANVGGIYWIVRKCIFAFHEDPTVFNNTGATLFAITIEDCFFFMSRQATAVQLSHSANVNNAAHIVQNCIFIGGMDRGVNSDRIGGILVRNCTFFGSSGGAVRNTTTPAVGQCITVNNCIFQGVGTGIQGGVSGDICEDFNTFFANTANRNTALTGANSLTYPALLDARWFFQMTHAGAGPYNPTQIVTPFDVSSQSQTINLTGTYPPFNDMRSTPFFHSQRDWGALELDSTLSLKARQASSVDDGGMIIS